MTKQEMLINKIKMHFDQIKQIAIEELQEQDFEVPSFDSKWNLVLLIMRSSNPQVIVDGLNKIFQEIPGDLNCGFGWFDDTEFKYENGIFYLTHCGEELWEEVLITQEEMANQINFDAGTTLVEL
jgi:hypothetical protein